MIMAKIAVHNPEAAHLPAHFGWGGVPYEIKIGETQMLDEHLVAHARKHNPHLVLMDESMGTLSFAESRVRLDQEEVDRLSAEVSAKTTELKRAQGKLMNSKTLLKAEQAKAEKEAGSSRE